MDEIKKKKKLLKKLNETVSGYTIQIGDAANGKSLEERIQAAKAASTIPKQTQLSNNEEKLFLTKNNNSSIEKVENLSYETEKKPLNYASELKNKNNFKVKNINVRLRNKCKVNSLLKSTIKNESKPNKLFTKNVSANCDNIPETIKSVCNVITNSSTQNILKKKHVPTPIGNVFGQLDVKVPKCSKHETKSTTQKNASKINHNILFGHCDRTKDNNTNTSNTMFTSVQNRLLRARNQMISKSIKETEFKPYTPSEILKVGLVKQPLPHKCFSDAKFTSAQNKFKKVRNELSGKSFKEMESSKEFKFSISSNVSKVEVPVPTPLYFKDKAVMSVQNRLIKARNELISKSVKETNFKFSIPNEILHLEGPEQSPTQTSYDMMEWEPAIESCNIVDKVNDLRKNKQEYEPMEWSPDPIMHSDDINYCLVIDTNILLSNLKAVTIVTEKYFPDYGFQTIVLPWQVVQELDSIKKGDNELAYRAREATRWLFEMLSKNHPRIKGQPMTTKSHMNPDDAILKCALIVKERVKSVTLLTDDINLSLKSKINNILVKNSTWLKNLTSETHKAGIFQEAVKHYPKIENNLITKFELRLTCIIAQILKIAVVRDSSSTVLLKTVWWKVYSLKTPFSLVKLLTELKKNWNMIILKQLSKAPIKQLDWLMHFFEDSLQTSLEFTLTWNDLYYLLKCCMKIINALPYEYYNITDLLLIDLMKARKLLYKFMNINVNELLSISMLNLDISSNLNNTAFYCIDEILSNILNKVDKYCLYVYQANGLERISSKTEPCKVLSSTENLNEIFEKYYFKISNIIQVMSKINKMKFEQLLNSLLMIDKFRMSIIEFDSNFQKVNIDCLTDYCLMKNKNMFLSILIRFQNNLATIKHFHEHNLLNFII